MKTNKGKVFLVGAGPGDPGLITVRGMECIRIADVVVYDYLAPTSCLEYASKEAELIYVGKKEGYHTIPQEDINRLIIEKARQGLIVTRLKGGDPYIFGRGGEEAETLEKEGIFFEVIPGVTAAIAAPAYAGIPLTHRDYTSTLAFVTGHEAPNKANSRINWSALATGIGTLIFFMGVKNLPNITRQLVQHGMPADTPIALVRWGTTPHQITVSGTLETIVEQVEAAGLKAPAIIVVGKVVNLRNSLSWFEKRPLFGKRIVVTRARKQSSDLVKHLSDLGAECLEYPTIEVVEVSDYQSLDQAIENIKAYEWLIFTSVNGVDFFFKRLFESKRDVRCLGHLKTATVGPETAKRLLRFGLNSDILPKDYRAESILEAFSDIDLKGKKIILPRAKKARPILPEELSKMGAIVDDIATYATIQARDKTDLLLKELDDSKIDLITFTSSSTVKNFKALLPPDRFKKLLKGVPIACIGPITADTARELGFNTHVVAETSTILGLCEAILQHFPDKGSSTK